jgi:Cu+-exporting ATPase
MRTAIDPICGMPVEDTDGVLALAILRAGAFLALATGATIVTWAPIPQLPWFTGGVWLFILVTCVQFIGG